MKDEISLQVVKGIEEALKALPDAPAGMREVANSEGRLKWYQEMVVSTEILMRKKNLTCLIVQDIVHLVMLASLGIDTAGFNIHSGDFTLPPPLAHGESI